MHLPFQKKNQKVLKALIIESHLHYVRYVQDNVYEHTNICEPGSL